jgi:cysteine desulfurase
LYVKDRKRIAPIVFGSGDELFPGSKPTALIAAFAKAVEMYKLNSKIIERNFNVLKKEIQKIDDVYINSETPSHVFSVSIKGVLLKDLIDRLQSFSFSSGCSCLGQGESNVKEAIDPKGKLPSTTLRISFSDKVPEQNLIDFARSLKIEVEKLRKEKSVSDNCQKEDQKDLSEALSNLNLQDL